MSSNQNDWVVFRIEGQVYALPAAWVGEMMLLPAVTQLPARPGWVRGVVRVRDQMITVADLRMMFGKESLKAQSNALIELLDAREQDHRRWLQTLENSINDGVEFTLTTDPHKCAFGRWYDTFTTDRLLLSNHLKRFDAPHRAIHAVGEQATRLVAENKQAEAQRVVHQARLGVLGDLIELFEGARRIVSSEDREILVTLRKTNPASGLCVDAIARVAVIDPDIIQPIRDHIAGSAPVCGTACVGDEVLMIFDELYLERRLAEVGLLAV